MIDDFDWGCAGIALGIVAVILFLGYIASASVIGIRADRSCKDYGYPCADVTYNLAAYCIKRVNQTDTVVELKKLRGKK